MPLRSCPPDHAPLMTETTQWKESNLIYVLYKDLEWHEKLSSKHTYLLIHTVQNTKRAAVKSNLMEI